MPAVSDWLDRAGWVVQRLPRHWAERVVEEADAAKSGGFRGYRRCLDRKIACLPRRYVAGKIFGSVASGLWTATAALQRLAF